MQKRFCSCGRIVLVRYISDTATGWRPLFLGSQHPKKQPKISLSVCPGCGASLNIHALR